MSLIMKGNFQRMAVSKSFVCAHPRDSGAAKPYLFGVLNRSMTNKAKILKQEDLTPRSGFPLRVIHWRCNLALEEVLLLVDWERAFCIQLRRFSFNCLGPVCSVCLMS